MKLIENILKKSKQERKHATKFGYLPLPIDSYWHKIHHCAKILELVENYASTVIKNKNEKSIVLVEARKNFVINCVTALEVFFKDNVKVLPEVNSGIKKGKGLKDLLESKTHTNLWEAYNIFKEHELRLGEIVICVYSFQNIYQINYVMSKLLNIGSYMDEVSNYECKLDSYDKKIFGIQKLCLKNDYPDWKQKLDILFSLRHDYVHYLKYRDILGYNKLGDLWYNLSAFITASSEYLMEKVET